MPSKILLISTNRCVTPEPVYPLGLCHISAALRSAGHDTRLVDSNVHETLLEETLRDYQPDFVGVSLRNIDDVLIRRQETYFDVVSEICETVRRVHPRPVILGGSGFSIFPNRLLTLTGADFGIRGEGEASLVSLIAALNGQGDLKSIPGLVYRQESKVVSNPPGASKIQPRWELPDRPPELVSHYLKFGGMLNLQTQRGCAHSCCYCTYPVIEGRAHRRRPPEAVADDMARIDALGAKYAFIVDSIFNSSPRHVTETCEAIIRRKLALRWGCFLRPQGLTPDLVKLMHRAGLTHIEFGSDSFCDSVLEAYGKKFTFDDVFHSSELARKEGIDYCHFLISGGPGETLETLQIGFENSRRLENAVILAVVGTRIYPGTSLFQRALREGRITSETDLLAPTYYLAPGLTADAVFSRLEEFARRAPSWLVGDPDPAYGRLVERLRNRGVAGPLWSYFAMLQRIMPQPQP